MNAIDERKRTLRKQFKQARRDLGEERRARIDEAIAKQVVALPEWQTADEVLPYLSVGDEVDTRALIRCAWDAGKLVAVPRVVGARQMAWYRISDFDHLEVSKFHVEEPLPDPAALVDPLALAGEGRSLMALVPALTIDEQGYRMGYGGGFYDAFISSFPGAAVGLIREAQACESLSALGVLDVHDQRCSVVVTENRILRF